MDKSEILDSAESSKAFDTERYYRLFHNTKKALNTFHAMQQIIAELADKLDIKDCIDEKIQQANKEGN
jgi:hypothetical protein